MYFFITLGIFFALTGVLLANTGGSLWRANAEITNIRREIRTLQADNAALTAEIAQLKKEELHYRKVANALRRESPIPEAMHALDLSVPKGAWISSVSFVQDPPKREMASENVSIITTSYTMDISAYVQSEDQIVIITNGLARSLLFSNIEMPSSKRDDKADRINVRLIGKMHPIRFAQTQFEQSTYGTEEKPTEITSVLNRSANIQ